MRHLFLSILLGMILLMTGCGLGGFESTNGSTSGLLLEQAFPTDTWFFVSFNTLEEVQRSNFNQFASHFSEDPELFRGEFLSAMDANLESVNLSYLQDIQPVLGESGFRFALGVSQGDTPEAPVMHAVLTVDSEEKAQALLTDLEAKGRFLKKTVNDYDLYFNSKAAELGQEVFYFSLYQDLVVIANSEDELVQMLNLVRSPESDSLWTKESYEEVVKKLPVEHVGLFYIDGSLVPSSVASSDSAASSSAQWLKYLKGEGVALVATEQGLDLRGVAKGDRAKIKADDVDLAQFKMKPVYLHQEMLADQLGIYLESYNLASVLERRFGESSLFNPQSFLGDEEAELADFLSEGYSVSLHQGTGFLPDITLMADVSEDTELAQTFAKTINEKLSNLIQLLQFQGGPFANAISKETLTVEGGDFYVVRVDVDTILSLYNTNPLFQIPDQFKGQKLTLLYGVKADRLLVSTHPKWLDGTEGALLLADDAIYKQTMDSLGGFDRGLVYVAFAPLKDYFETFEAFQKALNPEVTASAELAGVASSEEGTSEEILSEVEVAPSGVEVNTIGAKELLAPLQSFALSSDLGWYRVELGGTLLLDPNFSVESVQNKQ
ncbi:MAG: hypothetical protein ACD_28C00112G0007 [uncultured bacterium]|nr:MAG: hypothetical protein ACD_28C00112G0007 [uncultured bacterium]